MNDDEFRIFLSLFKKSDPWPFPAFHGMDGFVDSYKTMTDFADREAKKRGFSDWHEAHKKFMVG